MLKKSLSVLFIGLLVFASSPQVVRAQSDADIERNRVERIKTNIYRHGDSGGSKVAVKLRSGAKFKGYITKTGEDSFELTNYKTRQTTVIAYRDIAEVKLQGGPSKAGKYALGVAGAAAIVVMILMLPRRSGPTICPLGCR